MRRKGGGDDVRVVHNVFFFLRQVDSSLTPTPDHQIKRKKPIDYFIPTKRGHVSQSQSAILKARIEGTGGWLSFLLSPKNKT